MDILTVKGQDIKVLSILLTRTLKEKYINCSLIEIFLGENHQELFLEDNDIVSFVLNGQLIVKNCIVLGVFKNTQINKYNVYIQEA